MNRLIRALLIILTIGLVASCSGGTEKSLSYAIQIKSEQNIDFDDANIKIKLFGTHRMVADNAATLISETILPVESIPSTITLNWTENAHQLITEPSVDKAENAVYYLTIAIDVNSDGMLCRGDYRLDYKRTAFMTIPGMPKEPLTYYVAAIDNNNCQKF